MNVTAQTHKGIVKWFNPETGFGFIAIAPSLKLELGIGAEFDLYVNAADMVGPSPRSLVADQHVEFCVEKRAKGWRAVNVFVADQKKD